MRLFLLETPDKMSNIGDHAQLMLIEQWLRKKYPGVELIEYTLRDNLEHLLMRVKKDDLVFFCSGGNFGDFYIPTNKDRQRVVRNCFNNKIVILPKTLYFKSAENMRRFGEVYNQHKDLTVCCRDMPSYFLAQTFLHNARLVACPDFAVNLKPRARSWEREGVLGIMREDSEAMVASEKLSSICDEIIDFHADTFFGMRVDTNKQNRKHVIGQFLKHCQRAKVVVTDRMHGMYFSLITDTPCVGLPQALDKTSTIMDWFLDVPTLAYASDLTQLEEKIDLVTKAGEKGFARAHHALDHWRSFFKDELKDRFYVDMNMQVASLPLLSLMKQRRSIRNWYKYPVLDRELDLLLEAGKWAPSGANDQRVRFMVLRGKQVEKFCSFKDDWSHYSIPPMIILVLFDLSTKGNCNNEKIEPTWERLLWQDTAAAMQNMMLLAESLGLSTCWISMPQKNIQEGVRKMLKIKKQQIIACALFVGYSREAQRIRASIKVSTWNGRYVDRRRGVVIKR